MSNNQLIRAVITEDATRDEFLERAFSAAMVVISENPLIKQMIELEKKKELSIKELDRDVKFGTLYILDRIDEMEGNFETGFQYIQNELIDLKEKIIPTKTIVMKEISKGDAKKEIQDLINKNKDEKLFPSDISDKLNISYDLTIEIIQELIKEKKVEIIK